ncbi:MAG: hypothetical protein FWD48_02375 [Oscillospiraceae bacterium]|nr:hypothetical protein [Oscillospiraceae bacterium]
MNKSKLLNYELTASIHTVEIRSWQKPVLFEVDENAVEVHYRTNRKTGKTACYIKMNPHGLAGNEVLEFSLFEQVIAKSIKMMKIRKWEYSRIDVRLDCYDDSYQEYYKLNAFIVDLFTMSYSFKNDEATGSMGHRSRFKRSVYVKNQYICIDYYDKGKESLYRFPCKARLEFRMMKLKGKSPEDVIKQLFIRLDKIIKFYNEYLNECNKNLFDNYLWTKKHRPLKERNDIITPYIWANQDVFYNMKQLEEFCKMCGVGNPGVRAKSIARKTCSVEFISHKNVCDYISMIKDLITYYMEM